MIPIFIHNQPRNFKRQDLTNLTMGFVSPRLGYKNQHKHAAV